MPLGDSTTDGHSVPGGDRTGLQDALTGAGYTFGFVGSVSSGAWAQFPLDVAAGSTVEVTVDLVGGPNAVLSELFLGGP